MSVRDLHHRDAGDHDGGERGESSKQDDPRRGSARRRSPAMPQPGPGRCRRVLPAARSRRRCRRRRGPEATGSRGRLPFRARRWRRARGEALRSRRQAAIRAGTTIARVARVDATPRPCRPDADRSWPEAPPPRPTMLHQRAAPENCYVSSLPGDLRPAVAEADRAVEHRLRRRRVRIADEIAEPLELDRLVAVATRRSPARGGSRSAPAGNPD